jgi:hypothetical protein
MPVDRMWKAARIQRKVRPNYALTCCGSAQAVEKKLRVPARAGEAVEPPLRPPLLHRRKTCRILAELRHAPSMALIPPSYRFDDRRIIR